MPKIVLSQNNTWVAKEVQRGSSYWPHHTEKWFEISLDRLIPVTFDILKAAVSEHLKVQITEETPEFVINDLVVHLRNANLGMLFCHDPRFQPYYLSMISPDTELVEEKLT